MGIHLSCPISGGENPTVKSALESALLGVGWELIIIHFHAKKFGKELCSTDQNLWRTKIPVTIINRKRGKRNFCAAR